MEEGSAEKLLVTALEAATIDGDMRPNTLKIGSLKRKKTMLICGFYGYDIPCPYKMKTGKCNRIHCPIIREAFVYAEKRVEEGQKVSP